MKLSDPFLISSRLLPAIKVGRVTISLEPHERRVSNRLYWVVYFDGWHDEKAIEVEDDTLGSRPLDESTYAAFESLFCFLSAWVEGIRYSQRTGRESDNRDLFSPLLEAWALHYENDIEYLSFELTEGTYRHCIEE